ncbi:MAG: type II toxin-antitoxin system RelB/DinJ family antitoxin [Xenococcaceae cyanobacterium MO_188.B19]|nr:type II toxin-antitoxin system RelB/DinJ family antitoxin [Xenococcaceae cyanobacterium MO_188.B19]
MSKTATVRARIQPELKANVEEIFQQLGLTTTEAITLFYQQVALRKGLPFAVKIPNKTTEETFKKTDRGEELISCQSAEDMFDSLGI